MIVIINSNVSVNANVNVNVNDVSTFNFNVCLWLCKKFTEGYCSHFQELNQDSM
jgi:hypothetical protein